jgi:flagellar biosynthetic protein FliO
MGPRRHYPDLEVSVSDQKKKTVLMFGTVIIAGGLIGFVARASDRDKVVIPSAQTQNTLFDNPGLAEMGNPGFGGKELFFKMMLSVLLVVGLAVGALYLSKKLLPNITKACGKEIRVVETTYLGPRKALHLVEIGNQRLLIGSTNESIATLAHLEDAWLDLSKQELDHSVGA